MSGPLIPYLTLPEIPLDFLLHVPLLGDLFDPNQPPSIKPFGTLVAIGVYIGATVTMHRAKQRRLDEYTYFVIDLEAAKKPLRENAQPWHGICARP